MKSCKAGIGILALSILFLILATKNCESASSRYNGKHIRLDPPKPALTSTTTTPNPAIAASMQRVLIITGAVEHFSFLSGGEFLLGNNVDLSVGASENIVYLRLAGLAACVEDKEKAVSGNGAWEWLKDPVGGSVRKAELYTGAPWPAPM